MSSISWWSAPRGDSEDELPGEPLDARGRVRKHDVARADQLFVTPSLGFDQPLQIASAEGESPVGRDGREHADVVEAEVAGLVVLPGEGHSPVAQDIPIRLQVQALGVRDDAVEVEDDADQGIAGDHPGVGIPDAGRAHGPGAATGSTGTKTGSRRSSSGGSFSPA